MFCKACGYHLVGIATNQCPECARAFDPADASSFDAVPRRTRLKRWLKRLAIICVILALVAVFFPRKYVVCELSLRPPGGTPFQIRRTQLGPPTWLAKLGVSYPGWTVHAPPSIPSMNQVFLKASGRRLKFFKTEALGSCTSSANGSYGSIKINGVVAIPDNAAAIFKTIIPDMLADRSFGTTIGSGP